MKYNIDTKENFDIITPQIDRFEHDLAEELNQMVQSSIENKRSLIIDFTSVNSIDDSNAEQIIKWHHEMYNADFSFVVCNVSENVKSIISTIEDADILNITPKQIEAIDMVSMEGLERELLGGDENTDWED